MKKHLYFLAIVSTIVSCSPNPYKGSEAEYNSKLKTYTETISNKVPTELPAVSKSTISIDSSYSKQLYTFKDSLNNVAANSADNNRNVKWIGTVNFNLRKPNFIILHHTAQDSTAQTVRTFTLSRTQVSAHYIIDDNGEVIQMLNDYLRAWHAGSGSWGKVTDINSSSIGIELDNNGKEPFSESQISSLMALLNRLTKEYKIPKQNIIGHSDIAPSRKQDPSAFFPWKTLADNGFGVWYDEIMEDAPLNFNPELALRIIGYNTKNLGSAVSAFKLHYMQRDVNSVLDQNTINTIYAVYKKQ
ncbi:MAG: N-acetylmuramoyl-L-alanine amidase [Flavobacterium sp.]|jgi:N-acetyl-anhydromuramyl-L-alanine amidase AmpD|uniref:N-acetylmuramoyl-L-alanine amidase n=1 Tax=Flavobacterium frigidarium TaxID=99286 RepID=UPI0030DC5CE2|nr:N-acetylmuramoyl-L-alanine amidase [Flavobacterium sp.]|tara:strand:- start:32452 stop:33354 length:903 start_codon:yes stop_codon:yes gene_type:complete